MPKNKIKRTAKNIYLAHKKYQGKFMCSTCHAWN